MAHLKKRNKLPRQNALKIDIQGLPSILADIRGEPLTETVAVKLQPSLTKFLEEQGNTAELIRTFITNGLKRILEKPTPAVCSKCFNLPTNEDELFCSYFCAFLDENLLNQPFSCDGFQPKKKRKREKVKL